MGNVNTSSGNFSAKCPAGSQLVAIPDNVVAIIKTSTSPTMEFKSLVISVDNNARTVTATLNLTTNLQSPSFASSSADRPKLVNVYCVYPGELNQGGFGLAVAAGGSSVRDYVHSDGGAGCFQLQCAVYERESEPCVSCGKPIRKIKQAGRSTFYCPNCQK